MEEQAEVLRSTERWFLSRGIPHFIHGYSASRDILTRALPLLTLIFLAELLGALNFEWAWWANALAIAGGAVVLVGGWALANVLRRRRPLARPNRVGTWEIAVFVLVPALLPLMFGGQLRSAGLTAVGNLLLVAVIYLGASYGVVPMTRWALGRLLTQLGNMLDLLVRTLPLLALVVVFLFLQVESWEVAGELRGPFYWVVIGAFAALGLGFIVVRLPREIGRLANFEDWSEAVALTRGSPIEPVARTMPAAWGASLPLSRREWGNVGLVVVFSQAVQILLAALVMGAFFVGFGMVLVGPELVQRWVGRAPNVLATVELWGRTMVVTEELLRVAGFLGAFSGLYFTVSAMTDETYRAEFHDEVVGEVREAFAVRAVYLEAVAGHDRSRRGEPSPVNAAREEEQVAEDVRESRDEEQPRIDEEEAPPAATRAEAQAQEESGGPTEERIEAETTMDDRIDSVTNPDEPGGTGAYPPKPA